MSTSRRPPVAVAVASLGVAVLLARPARADDSELFFARGRTLRVDGKCADAIPSFRKAFDLRPDLIGSLRNIAECEEELGRYASARTDWWALRTASLARNEPRYAHWREDAEEAYRRLDAKVARLTVRLSGPGLNHVQVSLDGSPLHPNLVGAELERDPGPHVVEAFYGGAAPVRAERTLAAGDRAEVTLVIPAAPGAGADTSRSSVLRTAGYATLGAGGGFVLATIVAAVVRTSALSTVESECPVSVTNGRTCPTSNSLMQAMDAEARGKTANAVMDVFAVLGVACVAAGIPLVVIGTSSSPSSKPSAPQATGAALVLAPMVGGAQVQLGGRF